MVTMAPPASPSSSPISCGAQVACCEFRSHEEEEEEEEVGVARRVVVVVAEW